MFDGIIQDFDRIKKRQKLCKKNINDSINGVINCLQESIAKIKDPGAIDDEDSSQLKVNVEELSNSVLAMKPLQSITQNHKEYFAYISKTGKDIEKSFNKDVSQMFGDVKLDTEHINEVIAEQYLREGKFEIHESLKKELGLAGDQQNEKSFQEIHKILVECRKGNLEPAIEWAHTNEEKLQELGSDLLFTLYEQKFLQIMLTEGKEQTIKFARDHFVQFFNEYSFEIQRLMGSLIFEKPNEQARYADLFEPNRLNLIADELASEACRIYNTTPESPLYSVCSAGVLGLPKFLKYFSLATVNKTAWKENTEIPVSIELGKDFQYHSTFVCPVTKDVSTNDNPPMMLKCGHVISEHSIKRMVHVNRNKFKCPYCPCEQSMNNAKKVYFN